MPFAHSFLFPFHKTSASEESLVWISQYLEEMPLLSEKCAHPSEVEPQGCKIKKPSEEGTQDLGVTIFHTRVKNNLNSKNSEKKMHLHLSLGILRTFPYACPDKHFWIRDASSTNSICKSERPGSPKKVSQNIFHTRVKMFERQQYVYTVPLGSKKIPPAQLHSLAHDTTNTITPQTSHSHTSENGSNQNKSPREKQPELKA